MGKQQHVLTIEDDHAIRRGIVDALRFAGYGVLEAADGESGLETALRREYDLLLLDLVLPKRDGFDILQEVRRLRPTLPIIILTARGEEIDRIRGLRNGADDYVVKPFSVKELLARVEAVLRRSAERPATLSEIPIPGGMVDLKRREVRFDQGDRVELSQREADLIRYLALNSHRAISRDELLANVWLLSPRGINTRTIDMHITRLREKLRDNSDRPNVIITVRGTGYVFGNMDRKDEERPNDN
jgi:DNA-binding response OmpR family regulator